MFENELKFKINDIDKFLSIIKENNIEFTKEKHQIDTVVINKNSDGMNLISGEPVVRIREQNGKTILTLKVELKLGTFDEHEIVVDDINETLKILDFLGMRKLVVIDKVRKETSYQGFNLCFDYVKDLGYFLEIEYLTEEQDDNSNEKILSFASKFGLTENDIIKNTYNTLMCRKFNLR